MSIDLTIETLDDFSSRLYDLKPLTEAEVKALCDKVRATPLAMQL